MPAGGKNFNPTGSVMAAELEAIKLDMEYCFDNIITEFHIFSNSQDVVHAIRNRAEYLDIEEHIIDALRIMSGNNSVKGIWYIIRSNNKVAHTNWQSSLLDPPSSRLGWGETIQINFRSFICTLKKLHGDLTDIEECIYS